MKMRKKEKEKIEKVTFFFYLTTPTKVYTNFFIETITTKYIAIFQLIYYNFVD